MTGYEIHTSEQPEPRMFKPVVAWDDLGRGIRIRVSGDEGARALTEALIAEFGDIAGVEVQRVELRPGLFSSAPSWWVVLGLGAASGVTLDRFAEQVELWLRAWVQGRRKETDEQWREPKGYL